MKASELQIGDWVLWGEQHSNIDGDYDLEFYPHQIELTDFFFLHVNDWEENEELEFVKPIKLDEEILLANKFQPLGDDYVFEIFERNTRFNLERQYHSKWYIVVARVCQYIYYVHELQHALRLCGLNDLADNFKVE